LPTFERESPSYRVADTRRGDSLRRIALRELGHAGRWVELALLNGLRPPYLVDDEDGRADGVLVAGDGIRVPAASAVVDAGVNPDEVFGRDIKLEGGRLLAEGGDLVLEGGLDNYLQALRHRLQVTKRELGFHPEYGNFAPGLKGRKNGPAVASLAAFYVRSALLEDERTAEVPRCVASMVGDVLSVDADVVPVAGRMINFTTAV
jgi:hypothetical protein